MSTTITIRILKEDKQDVVPEELVNDIVRSYTEKSIDIDKGEFIPLRYYEEYNSDKKRNDELENKYLATKIFQGYIKKDTRTVCYCITDEDFISTMYDLARDICPSIGYYTVDEIIPEYVDDLPVSTEYVLHGPWDRRFERLLMDGHVTFDIVKEYGGTEFMERFSKKKSEYDYYEDDCTWNLRRLRDICMMCKTLKSGNKYTEDENRFDYHVTVEVS